uniref:Reverse transcriptase domain-containing protein n=1 Tax=Photinus pyralis TaxID=7054 RepID=A0A1Y1M732_PHOPY
MERVIALQLSSHLCFNKIIPNVQSGFKVGHSCNTALLKIVDDIMIASDKGHLTTLVLLDFTKAFDTINHKLLISILHYSGLSHTARKFMISYLEDRVQAVSTAGIMSKFLHTSCGVPQGSVLGPILFNIYISTFPLALKHCTSHFYADDAQLYYSFDPSEVQLACHRINEDLTRIANVSKDHGLFLNSVKTQAILFGRDKHRLEAKGYVQIAIGGKAISIEDCVNNLGLVVDSNLRFKNHISRCIQRGYASLKIIYRTRHLLTRMQKATLCNAMVLSGLNYCDTVYGPFLDSADIRKIQLLQNSCLRLIFGVRKFEPISYKLKELKWLNMKNRRFLHAATVFHNIIINRSPSYLYEKITFRTDVHNLNLRFKGLLTPPTHVTQFFKRSFSYCIANIYNNLPENLKKLSLISFKCKLRKFLLENQSRA